MIGRVAVPVCGPTTTEFADVMATQHVQPLVMLFPALDEELGGATPPTADAETSVGRVEGEARCHHWQPTSGQPFHRAPGMPTGRRPAVSQVRLDEVAHPRRVHLDESGDDDRGVPVKIREDGVA